MTTEITPKPVSPIPKPCAGFSIARSGDSPFKRILIHITLIIASIIAVYPALRVITISLRPNDTLLTTSLRIIPENATLDNYKEVLFGAPEKNRQSDFFLWIWNSISVVSVTSVISMILAAVSAYAFSRFRFPGRWRIVFLLTTQMIPAGMLLLPLFIMLAKVKMMNTALGLIIAYSVSSVPLTIWTLKGYYDTDPRGSRRGPRDRRRQPFHRLHQDHPAALHTCARHRLPVHFMGGWSEYLSHASCSKETICLPGRWASSHLRSNLPSRGASLPPHRC